jgi:site-specific DNA recombinase
LYAGTHRYEPADNATTHICDDATKRGNVAKNKGNKMRAIGYIRVSSALQADEGVSLDAQRARIKAWCLANGAELATIHEDAGISGGRADNRPGLQDALDDVCRTGGVLVVYSLSRLARSVRDTLVIADRLDKAGADLVSLSEKIDTTSAAGKMLFRLLAVLNEFERDLISERTQGAMNYKRSKGERLGAIPLGFQLGEDGRTLSPVPDEMATVELIRELSADALGHRAIARELTRRGIPTKTGLPSWTHGAIAKILARQPMNAA